MPLLLPPRPPLSGAASATRTGYLTLSNVVNDAVRALGVQGDPTAPAGTTWIGPAVTNDNSNPEFTVDTSGWTTYNGGSGTSTLTRVTSNPFRGVGNGHWVTDGAIVGQSAIGPMTGVGTYVQNDKVAIQCEIYSAAGGEIVELIVNEYNAAGTYLTTSGVGASYKTLSAGYQRITQVVTLANASCSRIVGIVTTKTSGAAQAVTLDIDCFMWEKSSVVNPYTPTSRSASRVQMPWDAGMFTGVQGWAAWLIRSGTASTAQPSGSRTILRAGTDVPSREWVALDGSGLGWFSSRASGGSTDFKETSALTFAVGDVMSGLAIWTPTLVGVSAAGAAIVTQAGAHFPAVVSAFDIGSLAGTSNHLYGDLFWLVVGNGIPTSADAAAIYNAFGSATKPKPTIRALDQVARGAHATAIWDGRTNTFQRRVGA